MTRAWLRSVARGLVGVLLYAQMAVAAYACPALLSGEAAGMPMPAAVAAPMPDCEGMAAPMDPAASNLCVEHCKVGQQSDQASSVTVPTALLNLLYITAAAPEPTLPSRAAAASLNALTAAAPPHILLHCVYRL